MRALFFNVAAAGVAMFILLSWPHAVRGAEAEAAVRAEPPTNGIFLGYVIDADGQLLLHVELDGEGERYQFADYFPKTEGCTFLAHQRYWFGRLWRERGHRTLAQLSPYIREPLTTYDSCTDMKAATARP